MFELFVCMVLAERIMFSLFGHHGKTVAVDVYQFTTLYYAISPFFFFWYCTLYEGMFLLEYMYMEKLRGRLCK